MKTSSRPPARRIAATIAALAAAAFVVAGCGSSNGSGTGTGTGADTGSAASTEGITLKMTVLPAYPPEQAIASVITAVAEEHPELGVKDVESTELDVAASWQALSRGDVDLIAEAVFPNQKPLYEEVKDDVTVVGSVFTGAPEGWFVPSYVVEGPDAPAPGLKRIDQLEEYKDVFDGKFHDEPAGWQSTLFNEQRMEAYGLDFKHLKLDGGVLTAQIVDAIEAKEPIVFYAFQPNWLLAEYDLVQLEEPKPYEEGCFTGGKKDCALPDFSGVIVANKGFEAKAPEFYAMLENLKIPLEDLNVLVQEIHEGTPIPQVGADWVEANEAEVAKWIG